MILKYKNRHLYPLRFLNEDGQFNTRSVEHQQVVVDVFFCGTKGKLYSRLIYLQYTFCYIYAY